MLELPCFVGRQDGSEGEVLDLKADHLILMPRTHTEEKESQLTQTTSDLHIGAMRCMCECMKVYV